MQLNDAVKMLKHDSFDASGKMIWADLGCGNGTFTLALASLLTPESLIYAIDTDRQALKNIPSHYNKVSIQKQAEDFITGRLPFEELDGILMANSLHYVKDKHSFLEKIKPSLKKNGVFLIVEYDTDSPNRWVPYPVSFRSLQDLFADANCIKMHQRPSVYGSRNLYSAFIVRE